MKKEDLIALGIDEESAKQVMALHGKTVTTLNGQVNTLESERDGLQEQLNTNKAEFDTLKESAKGNEELKAQLTSYETKLAESQTAHDAQLVEQKKTFSILTALKEAGALDTDIVASQLDHDTIKVVDGKLQGFDEQLTGLKESKPFLFPQTEPETPPTPKITLGGNPKGGQTVKYNLAEMTPAQLRELKEKDPAAFKQLVQQ